VLCSIRSRLLGLAFAAVIPLAALMMAALWSQWQSDRVAATERAAHEARILASEVDDHISALQNLLSVLAKAVSYDPADRSANDALLRKVQEELSGFDSHIFLFDVDGNAIGTSARSEYPPPNAHDRTYFREALADHVPAVGDPIQVRSGHWVVNVARAVKDETGKIRAVLTVGPVLDPFQDTLRLHGLPPGTAISIINTRGFVIAADSGEWIGSRADWRRLPVRLAAKEGSDTSQWSHRDNIERVNGFA
jgi:C4-dicarboxylate-specific signal transduction histidine kinase